MAIFLAIIAYFGWGIGDIFNIVATRKSNATSTTFWNLAMRATLYTLAIPFFLKDLRGATPGVILIAIITGLSSALGFYFYMKGSQLSNPALVSAISGSWGGISVIWGILFLGESVNLYQAISIIIIFMGLFLVTFSFSGLNKINLTKDKGIWLAFITMFLWSICGSFIKIPILKIGWFWPTYLLSLPLALGALIFKPTIYTKPAFQNKRVLIPVAFAALLITTAELSYNSAIGIGLIAIAAAISGSYATLTVLLSFFVFKEPVTKQQIAGIITTLLGIVALSILSF